MTARITVSHSIDPRSTWGDGPRPTAHAEVTYGPGQGAEALAYLEGMVEAVRADVEAAP